MTRTAYRFRLAVVCLALVALAFLQDPGRIAADTKLDLTLNPWGFLARALHLWDPAGFFGQVQNQAYGYLFPMGPFFGLGQLVELPGWVIQRLWWSVVLVVGFLGVVRLARHLGIGSPLARVLAGLVYVLGARYLTTLGPISSETWPMALVPWGLVPLMDPAARTPRSRGLRAAVPLLLAGGVNAVATLVILVLPAVWFATRRWTRAVWPIAVWWSLGVVLATAWWAVPLLVLGSVAPPFLDWIESSAVTTRFTDLPSVLRGTSSWVAYLTDPSGPVWQSGWDLVTSRWALAGLGLLAAAGLVGLRRWPGPERWFLSLGLLAGLVLVGLGHVGPADGVAAGWVRDVLDGALAPLRNTHKFQPVVTLVLSLGVAGLVAESRSFPIARAAYLGPAAVVAAGVTLVVVAMPALTGSLTRGRSYEVVPDYWRQVSAWLAGEGAGGQALIVPGAPFGDYLWGRSQDEPLQGLASSPWAVRDAVPLSSAGNIRLLDEIEARIGAGQGSPGLTAALARSGVRYLVVRNDLDPVATSAPRRGLVRRALRQSPGLVPRATFGPPVQGFQTADIVSPDSQELPYPAVEIWEVEAWPGPDRALGAQGAALRPLGGARALAGGPEALPALGDAAALDEAPLLVGSDAADLAGGLVVTDTPRRTEVQFGLMRDNRSATLTTEEEYTSPRRVHDYEVAGSDLPIRARMEAGTVQASASSSRSEVTAPLAIDPSSVPRSAIDGDPATAWRSHVGESVGSSWRVDLGRSVRLSGQGLAIALVADGSLGAPPRTVRVGTEAGAVSAEVADTDSLQPVAVPPGETSWLSVTLTATVEGEPAVSFGIREVRLAGVLEAGRPGMPVPGGELRVDPDPADPGLVVLTARTGERGSCVLVGLADACDPYLARQGEERAGLNRTVELPAGADVRVRVRPRPGPELNSLIDRASGALRVTASSSAVPDPAGRAGAAADRDLGTTWVAGARDRAPTLTLRLPEAREVTGLLFLTSPGAPASSPFKVWVTRAGVTTEHFTSGDGSLDLPAVSTDRITIRFGFTSPRRGVSPVTGRVSPYPVGVGEVVVLGADDLRPSIDPATAVVVPCGTGPQVRAGDQVLDTAVTTTVGALVDGLVLDAEVCPHEPIAGGVRQVRAPGAGAFLVDQVVFDGQAAASAASAPRQPAVRRWEPTLRVVRLDARVPAVLELGENFNAGWRATLAGEPLRAVRVDGWRQGWVVPAGTSGDAVITFAPDRAYRAGLAIGAVLAVALLAGAALPRARGARSSPPPGAGRPRARTRWGLVAAALVLAAGPVGGAAVAGAAVARAVGRGVGTWLLAAGLIAPIVVSLAWAWPDPAPPWASWVATLGALLAVAVAVAPSGGQPRAAERVCSPGPDRVPAVV